MTVWIMKLALDNVYYVIVSFYQPLVRDSNKYACE